MDGDASRQLPRRVVEDERVQGAGQPIDTRWLAEAEGVSDL